MTTKNTKKTMTNDNILLSKPDFDVALPIQKVLLSNGLRVFLCPQPQFHRTCVVLTIHAGSREEQKTGTAHMLEHMIFRGTKKYPSLRELGAAFEQMGTDFNAYTSREVTSFDLVMPPISLDPSLKLLAEVITAPRLTDLDNEREIIREEILSDYDEENNLINSEDITQNSLYSGSFSTPIAGSPKDIDKIKQEDVLDFFNKYYKANNAILIITGNILHLEQTLQTIEEAFSCMPTAPEIQRDGDALEKEPRNLLKISNMETETQSDILFTFVCPNMHDPRFPTLELIVRALDDGISSRLSRRLIDERALVYDADAYIVAGRDTSLLQIRASCRHSRLSKVVLSIFEILDELYIHPPAKAELQTLKNRCLWEQTAMLDSITSVAQWISSSVIQELPLNLTDRLEALQRVQSKDIKSFAGKELRRAIKRLVIVGNISQRAAQKLVNDIIIKFGYSFELSYDDTLNN